MSNLQGSDWYGRGVTLNPARIVTYSLLSWRSTPIPIYVFLCQDADDLEMVCQNPYLTTFTLLLSAPLSSKVQRDDAVLHDLIRWEDQDLRQRSDQARQDGQRALAGGTDDQRAGLKPDRPLAHHSITGASNMSIE